MPDYFSFDPQPRPPAVMPPPLACDAQFHVFGPPQQYPVRPGAAYQMPSATIARALAMHRTIGIERGVIVQATTYGADHQVVLDGLAAAGPNYRGCANASVLSERDDAYIDRLHRAGVRDHMGRPDPGKGASDPSLGKVIELLGRGNFWVMLSLSEKISRRGEPWDDVVPIARALVEAAPQRCVWASDWPHPVSVKQPPNEGALMDLLFRLVPDPGMRQQVLVANPAELFGFDA